MATLTCIETIPHCWEEGLGDGNRWAELGIHPGEVWLEIFESWMRANYPGAMLLRSGDEILGAATYKHPHVTNLQSDTPRQSDLPELPDSLWTEFSSLTADNFVDLIQGWHRGDEIDVTNIGAYKFTAA